MARKAELATTDKKKAFDRSKSIKTGRTKYKSGSVQNLTTKSCRLYLSYQDEDGKYRAKTKTYRPNDGKALTESKAKEALVKWAAQLEQDEANAAEEAKRVAAEEAERKAVEEKKALTVENYMAAFIHEHANEHEPRTVSEYERLLRNHIAPYLGSYPIDELNPEIVAKWVTDLSDKYAPRTVRKALIIFRAGMRQAVERDTIAKDPTRTVKPPKVVKDNPNALDANGRAKVLKFIAIEPTNAAYMGYTLALVMGMRAGEICGLTWRHVDLKRKKLNIVQSLGMDSGGKGADRWYIKKPKNEESERLLTIPDQLIEPLEKRLAHAREAAFANGMKWQDYYVIGGDDGSFMNIDSLSAKWHKTAEILELESNTTTGKRPRFHDLRHTWATKAVEDGTDIKSVSSYMGHKDANMTLNTYASADPAANARTAQSVANSMFEEVQEHANDGEVLTLDKTGTED